MSQSRQLAAIMFTDIVGYTALMGNDEQRAYALLKKNRELHKPIIEQFNGRWIKELGDGTMASFNTVSDAVLAAIRIQEACNAAGDFQLRIGIHQGEVISEHNDIYGDAVNIAARIQTLGVPGSVLFSKKVTDEIRNKSEFQVTSLGHFEFKNVGEPIEVFALSNPGFIIPRKEDMQGKLKSSPAKNTKRSIAIIGVILLFIALGLSMYKINSSPGNVDAGSIKSLAILPFENPLNDSTLTFLSDGIPENLINRFSNIAGIKVFARSATFSLKDSSRQIMNLRKLLDVDLVLTGQLMKTVNGYDLNCEMVDASNQSIVWGKKYHMDTRNVSVIEDSIISSLLIPLKIDLLKDAEGMNQRRPVNPDAYAEYMKGRHLSYGSTSEESEQALSHFREAIKLDPKYAAAYAAIANEKIVQSLFSTASQKEIINEARTAIEAAKALDPTLAEIYTSEGALKFYYEWDWQGAVDSYKKALELDPGNATIYIRYSATLADVGRYKEALPLAEKAVELDPVSKSSLHNLGWTNLVAGNFRKSTEAFGKGLELHPNWIWGNIKKAYGHVYLKEYDKALAHAARAEELFQDGWGSELLQVTLVFIYKNCGETEKANAVTNRFLKYAAENTLEDPWNLSFIYYLNGDFQKAIEWEQKTVELKSPSAYLMYLPIFYSKEFFQGDAHQAILRKMGFVK